MTNILLTGIPKSGKTWLVDKTTELLRDYHEQNVENISLGELVADKAHELWNTPKESVADIDPENQQTLREYAISEAGRRVLRRTAQHVIIDTPLTMYVHEGNVPNAIFNHGHIQGLAKDMGGLDYIVTVTDDAEEIGKRLDGTRYPRDLNTVMDWISNDIGVAEAIAPIEVNGKRAKHLVIPREFSEQTLAKLLIDPNPTISYIGFPITHLTPKSGDSKEKLRFKSDNLRKVMQFIPNYLEYVVGIVPMIIPDQRVGATKEREHTVFRDKHLFDKYCDLMTGFSPCDVLSLGLLEELRKNKRTGKPSFLIHPNLSASKIETFPFIPTLGFSNENEFFQAIISSRDSNNDGTVMGTLRRFLDLDQAGTVPRYASLQTFAPAVIIRDEKGRYLLLEQAKGKPFAGYLTPITGKREIVNGRLETARENLEREAWQEAGLKINGLSKDYYLHRTDYGSPRYVRFFEARGFEGKVRADNMVDHPEAKKFVRLSLRQILSGKYKIMPATLQYFKDVRGKD